MNSPLVSNIISPSTCSSTEPDGDDMAGAGVGGVNGGAGCGAAADRGGAGESRGCNGAAWSACAGGNGKCGTAGDANAATGAGPEAGTAAAAVFWRPPGAA